MLAQSRHQEAWSRLSDSPSDVELHHPVLVPATASATAIASAPISPAKGRRVAIRSDQAVARAIWTSRLRAILFDTVGTPNARPPDFPFGSALPLPAAESSCRNSSGFQSLYRLAASSSWNCSIVSALIPAGSPDCFVQPGFPNQRLGNVVRFAGHADSPVARLISHACQMTPSLRSPAITAVSSHGRLRAWRRFATVGLAFGAWAFRLGIAAEGSQFNGRARNRSRRLYAGRRLARQQASSRLIPGNINTGSDVV